MARHKIGRNDPCPCGSGRKYKKCCIGSSPTPTQTEPDAAARALSERHLREHLLRQSARRRRFGEIRPVISTVHKGHRFVAVGGSLYASKEWATFTDFLLFYVRAVMGKEWWEVERAKPVAERHPVVRWFDHWFEQSKNLERDESGLLSGIPDGQMAALLFLAYDLYILHHHSKLQSEVVARLRQPDQFYGARYELFVAAVYVRAGCDFEYEDETDTTRKHAEFVATYAPKALQMAVEAKARRRKVAVPFDIATIGPGVRELLLSAAEKAGDLPLIVFVELNLPPEDGTKPPSWIPEVQKVLDEIAEASGGRSPFAAVIFTNRPHIYGTAGEPDPSRHYYAVWPSGSPLPDELIEALGNAASQYGNVPSKFPDDFGDDG